MSTGNVELQGVTIVSPIRDTLQGIDHRRNIFRGVTVAVNTDRPTMQLRVADRNNRPIQGATCRVLNVSNNVLSFDGVDDHVIAPDLGDYRTNWTAEAWVRPSKSHFRTMILGTAFVSDRFSFMIGWFDGNLCVAYFDGAWRNCNVIFPPAVGNWFHIAGVRDNNILRIYINGALNNSGTYSTTLADSNGEIRMGRRWDGPISAENVFGGDMTELRVWNVSRTASQIFDNYNKRLIGNESGLYEYWPVNEGSGASLRGLVGNNNGTILGAQWKQDLNFPLFSGIINYAPIPFDTGITDVNGLTILNYQINSIHGLEVTLPGRRRFIMPFRQDERQILNWQVMLSDIIATFITSEGDVLINAEPENNDSNFLIQT